MALNDLAIKHLKPKSNIYRVADSGGLCLEISPTGGKLWRWRYYYHGKGQMLALGKYPALSLAEARKKRLHQIRYEVINVYLRENRRAYRCKMG